MSSEGGVQLFVVLEKVKELDRESYFIIRDKEIKREYYIDFIKFGAVNISKKIIEYDNIYSFIYNGEKRTLDIFYGNIKDNEAIGYIEISKLKY